MLTPEQANCQFTTTSFKKAHDRRKAPILAIANFRKTWDATKNKLCTVDNRINLHMTTTR